MVAIAKEVIGEWPDSTGEQPLRMDRLSFEYAVRILLDCILGKPETNNWKHLSDLLNILGECLEAYIAKPFLWPFWVPLPLNIKINKNAQELTKEIAIIIEELEAKEGDDGGANLVQYLKNNPEQTAQQILDEIRTVFIAGHETSASTLTWACVLLAQNPEFQEELAEEIQSFDADTTKDTLSSPLLIQFTLEVLRLFPAAWSFTRKCAEDIHTNGITLPKGATLILDLFNSHRDPAYFDSPDQFNPKRFTLKASEHPQYYMPFGAGPRMCIGNNLAIEENKIFIAELLRNYHVSLDASYKHSIQGRTTLRPEFGVPIHLASRN
jgi:cytochrome P450